MIHLQSISQVMQICLNKPKENLLNPSTSFYASKKLKYFNELNINEVKFQIF